MLSIVWGAIYLQPCTSKLQICIIHLFSEYHSRSDNILQKQSSPARLQVETWPHRFCQNIKTKLILQITIHHFELIDITNAQVFILYKLRQRYFRCTWFEVGRPVSYTFWLVHLWGFCSCFNCFLWRSFHSESCLSLIMRCFWVRLKFVGVSRVERWRRGRQCKPPTESDLRGGAHCLLPIAASSFRIL